MHGRMANMDVKYKRIAFVIAIIPGAIVIILCAVVVSIIFWTCDSLFNELIEE